MHFRHRILRLMLSSALWAGVVAIPCFAVQLLIWWAVPPISPESFVYACAPHHAIRSSALLFGSASAAGQPVTEVEVRGTLCLRGMVSTKGLVGR
jgi:hypothetical protein